MSVTDEPNVVAEEPEVRLGEAAALAGAGPPAADIAEVVAEEEVEAAPLVNPTMAAVAAFLANLPASHVSVASYPKGYHMLLRDLDGPIVWRDVLAWIIDHKAALPSGDECGGMAATAAACHRG